MLTAASVVYGSAMVVLVWSVESDWSIAVTYVAAALAGTALPPIGSCVRARWSYVLDQPKEVQTAFALEAVLDEAVFIVGPILVAILATNVSPVARAGHGDRRRGERQPGLRGPEAHRAARAPARPHGRGPAADAVAHRGAPGRRLPRPRHPVRRRRGDHRRVRRRAGPQGLGRRPARAVGARQPAVRRGHRRGLVEVRPGRPGPLGRPRHGLHDAAALLRRLPPPDGAAPARRRRGDRAHDGGRAVPDRAHGARVAADRGHGDHAHRDRRGGRARRHDQRLRGRPLGRLGRLPRQPRGRRGRRPGRADGAPRPARPHRSSPSGSRSRCRDLAQLVGPRDRRADPGRRAPRCRRGRRRGPRRARGRHPGQDGRHRSQLHRDRGADRDDADARAAWPASSTSTGTR